MMLKPQDIVILLKLIALGDRNWSYSFLAHELFMSPSEAHGGIKRATTARLFDPGRNQPLVKSLEEFLVHGIKYAFPPDHGPLTRGFPTSYAASPLKEQIIQPDEPPPVWPDPEGNARGYEFSPLYKSVPKAAGRDSSLYELLALVDALRDGRARERGLATRELVSRLERKR